MSEREQLMRAVLENTEDDAIRLVFSDWLEENGEPDRAEFIRLQVGGHLESVDRMLELFPGVAKETEALFEKGWAVHELTGPDSHQQAGNIWTGVSIGPADPTDRMYLVYKRGFVHFIGFDMPGLWFGRQTDLILRFPLEEVLIHSSRGTRQGGHVSLQASDDSDIAEVSDLQNGIVPHGVFAELEAGRLMTGLTPVLENEARSLPRYRVYDGEHELTLDLMRAFVRSARRNAGLSVS